MSESAAIWGQIRAHALDLCLAAVLLWELASGYRAGFVAAAAGIAGRVAAAVVAWTEAPALAGIPWVARWVPPAAAWLERISVSRHLGLPASQATAVTAAAFRVAAFLLIYWVVCRLILAIAGAISRAINRVPVLGGANRVGGAAVGLAISAVELGLLAAFALVIATDMHAGGLVRWIDRSWLVTHLDGPGQRAAQDALRRWGFGGISGPGAGRLPGRTAPPGDLRL